MNAAETRAEAPIVPMTLPNGEGERPRLRRFCGGGPGVSGKAAWEAYRAALAPLHHVTLEDPGREPEFFFENVTYQAVHSSLMRTTSSAQRLSRDQGLVRGGADQILVYLQIAGNLETRCGGRVGHVGPGDVAIFDYALPSESLTTDFTNVVLSIRRDRVPSMLLTPGVHGLVIARDQAPARMLSTQLLALLDSAEHLDLNVAEVALDAIVRVAAASVEAVVGTATDKSPADALRRDALAYIDASIADPDLTPARVARHLKLSRSTVYRMFVEQSGLRALILKRRLDLSLQDLIGSTGARQPLHVIASAHGFQSDAHFSRAFRARFGLPPQQYRNLALHHDQAWFNMQRGIAGMDPRTLVGTRR